MTVLSPTQVTVVWHGTLVKLLRSLYSLGLPEASKELRSVEQEVRWRLRRLRYRHLAFLAESSAAHMQERGSQELLAELLVSLERRWAEIEDSRTLVALMTKLGHLSESLMNRLEDKVLGRGRGLLAWGPGSAQCACRLLQGPGGEEPDSCPFIFLPNGPVHMASLRGAWASRKAQPLASTSETCGTPPPSPSPAAKSNSAPFPS